MLKASANSRREADLSSFVTPRSTRLTPALGPLEHRMENLLNRLLETENRTVIEKYETEISRLEPETIILKERVDKCGRPLKPFKNCFQPL